VFTLTLSDNGAPNHKLWQNIEPFPVSSRLELFPYWSNKASFANLPLFQRGEGYILRPWCEVVDQYELLPPLRSSFGNKLYVYHGFDLVGAYTYTRDSAFKALLRPEEIIERWPGSLYEEETLAKMSEEEAEKARRVPFEIREWKEKHGDELKDW
jgi:hypothetical protein